MTLKNAYIIDAIHTPFGRYAGGLAPVRADDLGAVPIKALMQRNPSVDWKQVDDVVYGCANQAGEDNRNVGRMSALLAGLPYQVPATTINRLCGSSLDAIAIAALIGAGIAVVLWWVARDISTENAYVVGNVTPISAEVTGNVVALFADDNMLVKAGEPLLQIDPVPYQLSVEEARADYRKALKELEAAAITVRWVSSSRSSRPSSRSIAMPRRSTILLPIRRSFAPISAFITSRSSRITSGSARMRSRRSWSIMRSPSGCGVAGRIVRLQVV